MKTSFLPLTRLGRPVALVILCWTLWNCGNPYQTAGGSSDTDNTVAVSSEVLNPDGSPAASMTVRLRYEDYLSPFPAFGKRAATVKDVRTDSLGRFRIDSVDTGGYLIEVLHGDSLGTAFMADLQRPPALHALPARSLEPTATLAGTVLFRAGTYRVFVQVHGLERMVPVDMSTGRYAFNLPAGRFNLRFVDPERARGFAKTMEVDVTPGARLELDTVVLGDSSQPFFAWRHSAEAVLNTTTTGGATTETLYDFPLLIRLDSSNFNFSQALSRGGDIRFSKPDGRTPLPHEIERWDSAGRRAEIWVRMDTVLANRRNQSVYMYWGKSDAISVSDGPAVFDTAKGHAAVWHLSDPGGSTPGGYQDATAHGNRGTGTAMGDSSDVEGVIGKGQRFNGVDQYIQVPHSASLRLGTSPFTLSGWVRADALTQKHQVLSKRPVTGPGNYEFQALSTGKIALYPGAPGTGPEGSVTKGAITKGKWHFVAFTRDAGRYTVYLDGAVDIAYTGSHADVATTADLLIGQDGADQNEPWNGLLDEVRVDDWAHSANWIRLSYMNQRPGNQVLEWRRFP